MAKVPIWNFCNVDNVCKELMSIIKLIIVFLCTVPMAFYKCTNSRRPCSYLTSPSAPPVMVWLPSGVNLIIARPSEWAYLIADTLIFDWSTHKTFEERHCKTPMVWLRLEWLKLNTFLFQICSNIREIRLGYYRVVSPSFTAQNEQQPCHKNKSQICWVKVWLVTQLNKNFFYTFPKVRSEIG